MFKGATNWNYHCRMGGEAFLFLVESDRTNLVNQLRFTARVSWEMARTYISKFGVCWRERETHEQSLTYTRELADPLGKVVDNRSCSIKYLWLLLVTFTTDVLTMKATATQQEITACPKWRYQPPYRSIIYRKIR